MNDSDYLFVLKALQEIPFNVGKQLLIDFLQGNEDNDSIERNKLYSKSNFGSMAYSSEEIGEIVDNLVANNLIKICSVSGKKFWKVLELTEKGVKEILNPELYKKKLSFAFKETVTQITEEDKKIFAAFGDFLSAYNDEQKKAIISNNESILCLAGAGSGKTTVLVKRIEFLVKYRSVDPKRILAITFTRKARQEMMRRLKDVEFVSVETFNSFCEKILEKHNDLVYDKKFRVINYKDKLIMMNRALQSLNLNVAQAIDSYFSTGQKIGKLPEQLARIFLNDCFFILDYLKFKNRNLELSAFQSNDFTHKDSANLVFKVCKYIEEYMLKNGLRDYADQLIDAMKIFEKHKNLVPEFDHILIDEYQDVNSTQIKLVDLLNPKNIFCVGDPRQSIFGWRGSDIKYILNFKEKYPTCETITLVSNYRSTNHIVDLINRSIKNMNLPDLKTIIQGEKNIHLLSFENEGAEFEFVIQRILALKIPRKEIFVLARTNKQLNELSQLLKLREIRHIVRSDETRIDIESSDDEITVATVHSIKGLEAEAVFIIGCNTANFPCKGSEHPVIEMVKVDEYDKEEEERRLFYVAMSRAKNNLYMTYTGKRPTNFITKSMTELIQEQKAKVQYTPKINLASDMLTRLKDWRREVSTKQGLPAFMVLHDKTLIELAQKLPSNKAELEKIYGFGPSKLIRYGDEIIKLVSNN
ncbi:UvrD-helicase domain-containing protein [Candidatus Woesearchaeota archaeon]|nr:UvrD-helicase domain-containing protein [Candidatus Woesearchaeota archaeon]